MLSYVTFVVVGMVVWGLITVDWVRVVCGICIFLICFAIDQVKLRNGKSLTGWDNGS